MTIYAIQEWRRGRPVTYRFPTLDAAREAAGRIFRETGITVGIEPAAAAWASVRGGKWHATVSPEPRWDRDERSLCGVTFRPLNVTDGGPPDYSPRRHWCAHCVRLTGV